MVLAATIERFLGILKGTYLLHSKYLGSAIPSHEICVKLVSMSLSL